MQSTTPKPPTTVLIVDDDLLVQQAVSDYLSMVRDLTVIDTASSGEEALEKLAAQPVDLVLMDVRMPGMGGLEATRAVRRKHPNTRVIMLTSFAEEELIADAIEAGALGYILKSARAAQIIEALRSARLELPVLSRSALASLMAHRPIPSADDIPDLTRREGEILDELRRGKSNAQIARTLNLSESAVKMHVRSLMTKFDASSRLEVVVKAQGRRRGA